MNTESIQTSNGTNQPKRAVRRAVSVPAIDVFESSDEVLVVADVPGASADELRVRVDHEILTIEADRYERELRLPSGIDATKIVAETKHGTLLLHLPKAEAAKARTIPVRAG